MARGLANIARQPSNDALGRRYFSNFIHFIPAFVSEAHTDLIIYSNLRISHPSRNFLLRNSWVDRTLGVRFVKLKRFFKFLDHGALL